MNVLLFLDIQVRWKKQKNRGKTTIFPHFSKRGRSPRNPIQARYQAALHPDTLPGFQAPRLNHLDNDKNNSTSMACCQYKKSGSNDQKRNYPVVSTFMTVFMIFLSNNDKILRAVRAKMPAFTGTHGTDKKGGYSQKKHSESAIASDSFCYPI